MEILELVDDGIMPTMGTQYSGCIDLYAREDVIIKGGHTELIPLGVKINPTKLRQALSYLSQEEFEQFLLTHHILLKIRSGLSKKLILANGLGEIDLDYPNEFMARVYNFAPPQLKKKYSNNNELIDVELIDGTPVVIKKGDKVVQISLEQHKTHMFGIRSDDERIGGFGSTGN